MQETQVQSLGQENILEEGNGNLLQYSCLKNPMDREAWWATVQSSQRAGDLTEHSQCIYIHTLENTNANV